MNPEFYEVIFYLLCLIGLILIFATLKTITKTEEAKKQKIIFNKQCMYCKKELKKEECNNPDDFGLHSEYINFSDKVVCPKCNLLVTITNRHLKRIIDSDYNSKNMKELENYILTINKKIDKII